MKTPAEINTAVNRVMKSLAADEYLAFVRSNGGLFNSPYIEDTALACLGLAGETGEAIDALKKIYRLGVSAEDVKNARMDQSQLGSLKGELAKELGDVLFYWMKISDDCGLSPQLLAGLNVQKLLLRANAKEEARLNANAR